MVLLPPGYCTGHAIQFWCGYQCGEDNDVSAGGCSDEIHEDLCEVVTISG